MDKNHISILKLYFLNSQNYINCIPNHFSSELNHHHHDLDFKITKISSSIYSSACIKLHFYKDYHYPRGTDKIALILI